MKLEVAADRDVNHERDENGLTYTRKEMIRTVLELNIKGCQEAQKRFPHLQHIISRQSEHLDGIPVLKEPFEDDDVDVVGG